MDDKKTEAVIRRLRSEIKWRHQLTYFRYKQIAIELANSNLSESAIIRLLKAAYETAVEDTDNE